MCAEKQDRQKQDDARSCSVIVGVSVNGHVVIGVRIMQHHAIMDVVIGVRVMQYHAIMSNS